MEHPSITAMRTADTQGELFASRSGAVTTLIGAPTGLRRGDVDSTSDTRTPPTTTGPGSSTSAATATRTTTTSRTRTGRSSSADDTAARHAGLISHFTWLEWCQAYLDCRLNKRTTPAARAFEIQQEDNLARLAAAVAEGTYTPGPSTVFAITRPKPREVWAAEFADRVVHHLLYNAIAPRFHRAFIADSCACIPGRGTMYGAQRLEAKVRSITQNWSRPAYYLKLDIESFFVTIHKPTLAALLERRIPEPHLRALAHLVLFHDPRPGADVRGRAANLARIPAHKSLLRQSPERGLPIGNLSSQFFANVYLDALDQHVKHRLFPDGGARHYIRYVDDMVLLHQDPAWLNTAAAAIDAFLQAELGVRLNPRKTILQPLDRGVDFVGQVIAPWRRTTRRRTVRVALRRLERLPGEAVYTSGNSYLGLLRTASHSHRDRCRVARVLRRRGHGVSQWIEKVYR